MPKKTSGSAAKPSFGGETDAVPSRFSDRGIGSRRRGRRIEVVIQMLQAAAFLGQDGQEFPTSAVRDRLGIAQSTAYSWLTIMEEEGLLSKRLDLDHRPAGTWMWTCDYQLVRIKKGVRKKAKAKKTRRKKSA